MTIVSTSIANELCVGEKIEVVLSWPSELSAVNKNHISNSKDGEGTLARVEPVQIYFPREFWHDVQWGDDEGIPCALCGQGHVLGRPEPLPHSTWGAGSQTG